MEQFQGIIYCIFVQTQHFHSINRLKTGHCNISWLVKNIFFDFMGSNIKSQLSQEILDIFLTKICVFQSIRANQSSISVKYAPKECKKKTYAVYITFEFINVRSNQLSIINLHSIACTGHYVKSGKPSNFLKRCCYFFS